MIDQKKYIHYIEMYRRAYTDLQKEKQYRNGQDLRIKVKIDQEQYHWVKKAVSRTKNKQKSAAATQPMDISDLEISSVLL